MIRSKIHSHSTQTHTKMSFYMVKLNSYFNDIDYHKQLWIQFSLKVRVTYERSFASGSSCYEYYAMTHNSQSDNTPTILHTHTHPYTRAHTCSAWVANKAADFELLMRIYLWPLSDVLHSQEVTMGIRGASHKSCKIITIYAYYK